MQVVVGSNPHGGELVVESGRGGARRGGAGRGSCGAHLSDLGIVTQRDCASSTLHFLLLVVHMEWKILIEHIPNPASDKFKAYFIPNFGHICTKI